jgi:hypothetical protein
MESATIIGLVSVSVVLLGIVIGAFRHVRSEAREAARVAQDKADAAMAKAHQVEVNVAREYVSHAALRTITDGILRELDKGFKHINDLIRTTNKGG